MKVMAHTSSTPENTLRGNKYERKKARFSTQLRDMPIPQDLHPNQMLSRHLKGLRSY